MGEYTKALDNEGWSEHYNIKHVDSIVSSISSGNVSVWSEELLNICPVGAKILEIGCGSGASSLWLAKNGRKVTALDYTESSISLVNAAARRLGIEGINTVCCDATKELPFAEKEFDYIFQAGLLEHFHTEEQISLLRQWSKYGNTMISLIPNSASIPYRVGKQIMEENGTWEYGLEIPKHSFKEEFSKAGLTIKDEYTIGTEWAMTFLPKKHYVNKLFTKLIKDGYNLDEYMQGYLLVTIGRAE